mgnify:CR=1 FL=1
MKATTLMKAALVAGSLSFLAGSAYSQQSAVSGAGGYTTESLGVGLDRKSTRLNSSHKPISYAVCCLKKQKNKQQKKKNNTMI